MCDFFFLSPHFTAHNQSLMTHWILTGFVRAECQLPWAWAGGPRFIRWQGGSINESACKVGVQWVTYVLCANGRFSQLQLQSFTMGRTTRVIVVLVPPLKLHHLVHYNRKYSAARLMKTNVVWIYILEIRRFHSLFKFFFFKIGTHSLQILINTTDYSSVASASLELRLSSSAAAPRW